MRIWHDKEAILQAVTAARVAARDTVPRSGGNDAIEAGMFIAMLHAFHTFAAESVEQRQAGARELVVEEPQAMLPLLPENSYDAPG